ncbi:SRPBCC family protein [Frigidibacter sp. MR17.24]|uniref:SRPBCC family protein n=1 Tax=Frigidibacter sp. MR17.24 TaxID=3127345 RepID=UPI00301315B5
MRPRDTRPDDTFDDGPRDRTRDRTRNGHRDGHRPRTRDLLRDCLPAIGIAAAVAGLALLLPREAHRPPDSAPGRAARRARFGDRVVEGRSVTIAAPRQAVWDRLRDTDRWPDFMETLRDPEHRPDGTLGWTLATPFGHARVVARICREEEGRAIAWVSTDASEVEAEGKVMLRDAPAARGTVIEAHVAYRPPGGLAGHWIARAFGRSPGVQGRQELKRLKMLIETGEIATNSNRRSPAAREA